MDPEHWTMLETMLGTEILATVCGPFDDGGSEDRLTYLLDLVGRLQRTYGAHGVRDWFLTPSSVAGGVRPTEVLTGPWTPADQGPARLLESLPPARP